jgi:hypothetical protein
MTRQSTTRYLLKWVGLLGLVFVGVTYGKSLWTIVPLLHGPVITLEVSEGAADIEILHDQSATNRIRGIDPPASRIGLALPQKGVSYTIAPNRAVGTEYRIPLWIPFVLMAVPTTLLWWRGRPKRQGCCQQCGYNLTGSVSGRCPECGTEVVPPASGGTAHA